MVRRRRGRMLEREYISLREHYYHKSPTLFSEPGYLARSRELLRSRWNGPKQVKGSVGDVRIFAASPNVIGAIRPLLEIQRNFDAVAVDFGDVALQIERGDLAARRLLQQRLLDAFYQAHRERSVDLAWFSSTYTFTTPETLNEIRKTGVPVAVLNTDDKHLYRPSRLSAVPTGQTPLIGSVDVHLTNSLECVRWYMGEGVPAYYAPQGVDPEIFRPLPVEKDLDVSFIGAAYGMRCRFVEHLQKAGVRVACFGRGWGTRFVTDEERTEIVSRSKINLGIGGVGASDKTTCIKGRDLQVPCSGNLYLTIYDAELARLWRIGSELLCYANEIDCIEQIRYYLERPEEAEQIGRAARERALREHTWTHRLVGLLKWMGILAAESSCPE
jgi:hypothetical protein